MSKRILLVAFHFPPIKASSGLERTLALTRHLPSHGWQPIVLSASAAAYPSTSDERLGQIPEGTIVERCFARDASRHFAIAGRYPAWVCLPDRWQSWILGAVPRGLAMIRQYQPDIIWSTYPIASAHWIGYILHRLTGIPWIADFRDPMVEHDDRTDAWSPAWSALRRSRLAIERRAAAHAAGMSFCTQGARKIYMQRYPESNHKHWEIIPNGFDETAFAAAEKNGLSPASAEGEIVLVHSGTIYPSPDRDPTHFFRALRRVLDNRPSGARSIKVKLRASSVENHYTDLLTELRLTDHVEFPPAIPYESALTEMMRAAGVIIFQGYTSNPAIPAKLYEYFRARRPILVLADADGDTASLVRSIGAGMFAQLDNADQIAEVLEKYIDAIENSTWKPMTAECIASFERSKAVAKFSSQFDEVLADLHA